MMKKSVMIGDIRIDYFDYKNAEMHIPGVDPEVIENFEIDPFDYSRADLTVVTIYVSIEHITLYTMDPTGKRHLCTPKRKPGILSPPEDDWEDEFEEPGKDLIRSNLFDIELQDMDKTRVRSVVLPDKKSHLVQIKLYTPSPTQQPPFHM